MIDRRTFICRCAAFLAAGQSGPPSHAGYGFLNPPVALPDLLLTTSDNRQARLSALTHGRITLIMLMWTQCQVACPIEVVLCQRISHLVKAPSPGKPGFQILSLSVDPLRDTPSRLQEWRKEIGAPQNWLCAVPGVSDLNRMQSFFGSRGTSSDTHSSEMFLVNRSSMLTWRSASLPDPVEVSSVARTLL